MGRGWFVVKVDLESGRGQTIDPTPGRLILVGPEHTLMDLAVAIDLALARWDPSHLHEFRFKDGRRYGPVGPEFDGLDGQSLREAGQPHREADEGEAGEGKNGLLTDYKTVKAASVIRQGEPFEYVFDFAAEWRHQCVAIAFGVDPTELAGIVPVPPVAVWGWGDIPDQYGRTRAEEGLGGPKRGRGRAAAVRTAKDKRSAASAKR